MICRTILRMLALVALAAGVLGAAKPGWSAANGIITGGPHCDGNQWFGDVYGRVGVTDASNTVDWVKVDVGTTEVGSTNFLNQGTDKTICGTDFSWWFDYDPLTSDFSSGQSMTFTTKGHIPQINLTVSSCGWIIEGKTCP